MLSHFTLNSETKIQFLNAELKSEGVLQRLVPKCMSTRLRNKALLQKSETTLEQNLWYLLVQLTERLKFQWMDTDNTP